MGKDKFTLAPGYKIYGALGLGLATAIAFRALIVINHVHPDWVRPVWYFAVLGNFFFFYHRFRINPMNIGKIPRLKPTNMHILVSIFTRCFAGRTGNFLKRTSIISDYRARYCIFCVLIV
jgi:hypothetical protein